MHIAQISSLMFYELSSEQSSRTSYDLDNGVELHIVISLKPKTIDLSSKNVEEYLKVNHLAVETVRHSDNFSGDSETAASECLRSPPSEVILSWST